MPRDSRTHITRLLIAQATLLGAVDSASAAEMLPVGTVVESTLLSLVLKAAAIGLGGLLLVAGVRFRRLTMGFFFGVVGLAAGLGLLGSTSYLLALGAAVLILAVGMAAFVWVPRVAVALSMFWPLALVYGAYLYYSGSFERSLALALVLVVAGMALGAVAPVFGVGVLASALGPLLLLLALPGDGSFWGVMAVFVAGLTCQVVLYWREKQDEPEAPDQDGLSAVSRSRQWSGSVAKGLAGLAAVAFVVTVLAPRVSPATAADPARLRALVESGELDRPGLLLMAEDSFYLSGRAVSPAIVTAREGILGRLGLPVIGRSSGAAIHRLRAVKDVGELDRIRRAAAITSVTFGVLEERIRPGVNEADLDELIMRTFAENGATGQAFDNVVASGANAVLPHYMANDAELVDGLIVIDIGAGIEGYASDMTRTFPVTGSYTEAQLHLMETVEAARVSARDALGPGATMRDLDTAAREVIDHAGFGPYFSHYVGHHVGLHVHDPGGSPFTPGMVVTIEPGIYVPAGADIDPEYWNLGVRIEDLYAVTEDGWEELTDYPRIPGSG